MKIGFACILLDNNGDVVNGNKTTTRTSFLKLSRNDQYSKIYSLCISNLDALYNDLVVVSKWDETMRMMRITSDLFPLVTLPEASFIYNEIFIKFSDRLFKIGEFARNNNIRLSFHPDQFVIINNKPDVMQKSIDELIVHAHIFDMMGYKEWHDAGTSINIHTGAAIGGIDGFIRGFNNCPEIVKKFLTVENDEYSFNIQDMLPLAKYLPIVFDTHHQEINTGQLLARDSDDLKIVLDSWRDVRPKLHYSIEPYDLREAVGSKRRKHGDNCWDKVRNNYVLTFSDRWDIMVEMKNKNLASRELFVEYRKNNG